MKVSINIPFYNRFDNLSRCIESIENNTPGDLYELVLINDGSTDEQVVEYAKRHADILINHEEIMGSAQSRFDGVINSNGRYICTCDSDIVVPPKWLETLLMTFEMDHLHPDLSKIRDLSDRRWVRVGVDVKILAPLLYGRVSQNIFGNQLRTTNWILLTKEVGTYCMLFEKKLIDLIGNFDPRLFMLWEDLDFSRRVSHNVFNLPNNPVVALDTRVIVYHHGWCDPITGVYHNEPGANTRGIIPTNSFEKKKLIEIAKGIKIILDRWGDKWEHPANDFYMKLLVENGIDLETPLCESWKNFPLYNLKSLE